jgi:hypothetical protein
MASHPAIDHANHLVDLAALVPQTGLVVIIGAAQAVVGGMGCPVGRVSGA